MPSRNDVRERLDLVVEHLNPVARKNVKNTERWDGLMPEQVEEKKKARQASLKSRGIKEDRGEIEPGAPYEILTAADESITIKVTGVDGDVIAGRGKTRADALTQLEKKLGLEKEK